MVGSGIGDEFDLIAKYFAPLSQHAPGALGLKDDAAIVDIESGHSLVVTTDALVAGIHFMPGDPAGDIARKAIRVNLSDLAAMGARPVGVLLSAVFPKETEENWLEDFARGLGEDIKAFGVPLLGGDTVSGDGPLTLSITALGAAARDGVLSRAKAAAGDDIFVSGTIGDGLLGLEVARGRLKSVAPNLRKELLRRYRRPDPRLDLGVGLVGLAHAAIDVSDGLLADLGHVCACSGVGARISAGALPLSEGAKAVLQGDPARRGALLGGGDDYELLFTAPPSKSEDIDALSKKVGVRVSRIGTITEGSGIEVEDASEFGLALNQAGYQHFAGGGVGGA